MGIIEHYFLSLIGTLAAIILIGLGLGTEQWFEYTVDRAALKAASSATDINRSPIYFTRSRGLFRTCLADGSDVQTLLNYMLNQTGVGDQCIFETGYELVQISSKSFIYGDAYETRKHVMRFQVASLALGGIFSMITLAMLIYGCWFMKVKLYKNRVIMISIAIMFTAGGMGCFHGVLYLEQEKIKIDDGLSASFPAAWNENNLLKDNYKISFGYSYILSWVAVGCQLFAMIVMLVLMEEKVKEKEFKDEPIYGGIDPMYGGPEMYGSPASIYGNPALNPSYPYPPSKYDYPVPYLEAIPQQGSQHGLINNDSLYYNRGYQQY